MFPKSNVKLFGNERSDRFHVAGIGTDARASINLVFAKHWMLRLEGKAGYINMWDIKTTLNNKPDKAQQDFVLDRFLPELVIHLIQRRINNKAYCFMHIA